MLDTGDWRWPKPIFPSQLLKLGSQFWGARSYTSLNSSWKAIFRLYYHAVATTCNNSCVGATDAATGLKDRTPQLCQCKRLLCPNGIVLLGLEILLANSYSSSCAFAVALPNPCGTSCDENPYQKKKHKKAICIHMQQTLLKVSRRLKLSWIVSNSFSALLGMSHTPISMEMYGNFNIHT